MTKDSKSTHANDGYTIVQKGHQPTAIRPSGNEQAGHTTTTSQGGAGPGTPPNQGSGGSKK